MHTIPEDAPVLPEVPERWRNVVIGRASARATAAAQMPAEVDRDNLPTIVPSPAAATVEPRRPDGEPFGPPEAPAPFREAAE